jgi:fibronectin-binding autotransporter adhesin
MTIAPLSIQVYWLDICCKKRGNLMAHLKKQTIFCFYHPAKGGRMKRKKADVLYGAWFVLMFLWTFGLFAVSSSQAADTYWRGGDGNWSESGNWDADVPQAGDSAFVNPILGGIVTYDSPSNPVLHHVEVNPFGATTLSQNQGALTIGSSTYADGNGFYIGSNGTYDLSGNGELNLPVNGGNWFVIDGDFNQGGGKADVDITAIETTGIFTQNAGEFKSRDFFVNGTYDLINGYSSDAGICVNGNGVVNNTGGVHTADVLYLAEGSTGGTYNLFDTGTLETTSSVVSERYSGGVFNQFGGSHTTGDLTLGNIAYFDGGTYYQGEGTYNLVGGDLAVNGVAKIGNEGIGYFHQDGGIFTADQVWLGVHNNPSDGAYGEYNLSDGLLATNYLIIGGKDFVNKPGKGVFNQTGGNVNVGGLWVADTENSAGTYNLNTGTLVVNSYDIIGMRGQGTFNQDGGTHTAFGSLELGGTPTAKGMYNLSGGSLTTNGTIVGSWGEGEFYQTGGTHTINGDLIIGANENVSGTYNLSGPVVEGSSLIVHGNEYIGKVIGSTGTFNQAGGFNTVDGSLYVDMAVASKGIYNLSGGILSVTGNTIVGSFGNAVFNQGPDTTPGLSGDNNGGIHAIMGDLILGEQLESHGIYNLSGGALSSLSTVVGIQGEGAFNQTGGTIYTEWMDVGNAGIGTFNQSGGSSTVANYLVLGREIGATGTYDLSGESSVLLQTNETHVGAFGTGTFRQNGGDHTTGTLVLGYNVGGNGNYELNNGNLTADYQRIGIEGTGTFTQTGGTNTVNNDLVVGQETGSTGTYNLGGGISEFVMTVMGNEWIGALGTGTVEQSGGTNKALGNLYIGHDATGNGTYNLSGGLLDVSGNEGYSKGYTIVGHNGIGEFNQSAGSEFRAGVLVLGGGPYAHLDAAKSTGTYNMSGGTLTADLIEVGRHDGKGIFNQTGGSVTARVFAMGDYAGGDGEYTISNDATLNVTDKMDIGYEKDGKGVFTQKGDSSVTVASTIYVGNPLSSINGIYDMQSGTLRANKIVVNQGGQFINSGGLVDVDLTENHGILSGKGTFTGDVINSGTLKPGSSPGTLTIAGNYIQDNMGWLEIEMGGYTQGIDYDYLDIDGDATLLGGLKVDLLASFNPLEDSIFTILHADGELSGEFSNWILPTLDGGKSFQIVYDYDSDNVFLKVLAGGPAVVPEPGTLLLVGLGIAALAFSRRKLNS